MDAQLFKNVNLDNIKIGKTFKYGSDLHLINIYYSPETMAEIAQKEKLTTKQEAMEAKTRLIIQTPLLHIINGILDFGNDNKQFLEMFSTNDTHDTDIQKFATWFNTLEQRIYGLIKKRSTLNPTTLHLTPTLKPSNSGRSYVWKLLTPINKSVSKCILADGYTTTYGTPHRDKILFNWDIPTPTYGISILWIKNIWIKGNKWGINLFTYATRVMPSMLSHPTDFFGLNNKNINANDVNSLFPDPHALNKNIKSPSMTQTTPPEYEQFFKMLKMGVPKDAVKQKIIMSGLNPNILDNNTHDTTTIPPPLPPPPPPPPFNKINSGMSSVLNAITSGGFKLKNAADRVVEQPKIQSKVTGNKSQLMVPTLDDITKALARLKKFDPDAT